MSDRIIRLGGSNINQSQSIHHLKRYLSRSGNRSFIVFSAVPEIKEQVESAIQQVFQHSLQTDVIQKNLESIFTEKAGSVSSPEYKKILLQLINILKGIALIGDYSKALRDQVLSFSEKLTAAILLELWNTSGKEAEIIYPEEIGLQVTADYGNATYTALGKNRLAMLTDGFYLLPGSYGMTKENKIARAGTSAADYTAAFLTRELEAEKLELWGLDSGFQRADPLIVPHPQVIKRLTYSEASELAYFDHYSFHPRTVEPLETKHIPIVVIDTASPDGNITTVINTEAFIEEQIVKSVACSDDISLLKLDGPGVGLKPGILAKVTSRLNDYGINIKSVITSQTSINFILEKETGEKAIQLIQQLGFSSVRETKLLKDVSLIGIVGHGMQQNYGVSARIFNAVAKHKINVVLSGSGASDLVSYLIVKTSDKEKSVRAVYNAFFVHELNHPNIQN